MSTAVVQHEKVSPRRRSFWRNDANEPAGRALKLSYLSLQQVDLVLTVLAVSLGFSELNPFMKGLLSVPLQLLLFKSVIPLLIAWFVPGRFLIPAIALIAGIVGWNVKELLLLMF